jgi:hypothetical protein
MLINQSYVNRAVSRALEEVESAGAESAMDGLLLIRDECDRRIEMERRLQEAARATR